MLCHLWLPLLSNILWGFVHLSYFAVIVLMFCQLEPGGHQSSRFVLSLSALCFSLRRYLTYYFRQGDAQTRVEAATAVKVSTSNLVRPWSRVTWQVHAGIRLTRKPLSKPCRVNERSWAGRDAQRWKRERQSRQWTQCYKGNLCLRGLYVFMIFMVQLSISMLTELHELWHRLCCNGSNSILFHTVFIRSRDLKLLETDVHKIKLN